MLATHKATAIGRDELHSIPVPTEPPFMRGIERAIHWRPIAHAALADGIVSEFEGRGFRIIEENWALCRQTHGLVFSLDLEAGTRGVLLPDGSALAAPPAGLRFSFGGRHSNDGFWALTALTGARVIVCANGMLVGDFLIARKHTSGVQLPDLLRGAVDRYLIDACLVGEIQDRLTSVGISTREGDSAVISMAQRGAYPWQMVEDVAREWREPRHPEFAPRNAWSLYNAVTEAAKRRPPALQVETLGAARDLLLHPETLLN